MTLEELFNTGKDTLESLFKPLQGHSTPSIPQMQSSTPAMQFPKEKQGARFDTGVLRPKQSTYITDYGIMPQDMAVRMGAQVTNENPSKVAIAGGLLSMANPELKGAGVLASKLPGAGLAEAGAGKAKNLLSKLQKAKLTALEDNKIMLENQLTKLEGNKQAYKNTEKALEANIIEGQKVLSQPLKSAEEGLYHGTYRSFDKFDVSKLKEGNLGKGIYLTNNKQAADYHSLLADRNALIKEVNPSTLQYRDEKLGTVLNTTISNDAKIKTFDKMPTRQMVDDAKKAGFDGVRYPDELYKNTQDWNSKLLGDKLPENPITTLVFNPEKVSIKKPLK